MHNQDSGDQFQTLNDQLLTYSFSSHIPSRQPQNIKTIKKNEQKVVLNVIYPPTTNSNMNNCINNNDTKQSQRCYTNEGRIIKIGDVYFKSNFESGSLGEVSLKGANTYRINLDKENNSNRISSWFYFRCQGLKGEVNLVINGFTKSTSLFNEGMKVCYREIKDKKQWKRGCTKISYSNSYSSENEQALYELKFTYFFKSNQQCPVEFAYCFPYQYSRICNLAKSLNKISGFQYQSLGKSYQDRDIPLLTIGNPNALKSIVISARVHPGETVASFIMEGFLKQLASQSEFAKNLKERYLFKIIPMINPDGVVRGHYRFSAAGYDLNRKWKHCYQSSHPEIYYLKTMIKKLNKQKKVAMYIDIHGHSRKKDVFFYGCCSEDYDEQNMSKPKQFPFLMQKINSNFKYDYCTFNVSKDKQGTARIQMWKDLRIDHVYTLESTLCGSSTGGNFYENDYFKTGKSLLQGMSVYFYEKPCKSSRQTMAGSENLSERKKTEQEGLFEKMLNLRDEAKQELKNSPTLLKCGMNGSDSGSDSQPEAGLIPEQERLDIVKTEKLKIPRDEEQVFVKSQQLKFPPSFQYQQNSKKSVKQNFRTISIKKKTRLTPQELKNIVDQKIQQIKEEERQNTQNKLIAKTVTNFYSYNSQQLDCLTTDSLSKRNERVHSKVTVGGSILQKIRNPRMNSQNHIVDIRSFHQEQDQKQKVQIMNRNLLKTRQGAQYRRVRIIAEEMKRKSNSFSLATEPPIPIVRGIMTVNNQLHLNKKKTKLIAPSFYPQTQQKNRRFSVEIAYKNSRNINSPFQLGNKKIYINGDDLRVHCKGTKIYL